MKYLIYYNGDAFYAKSFDFENKYSWRMLVFNLIKHEYTYDGINWHPIEQDHL